MGASEIILRVMVWLCLRDDQFNNSQMCIIVGPNIDLAEGMIQRIQELPFNKWGVEFSGSTTSTILNHCDITAYPSNHLDAYRSLTGPAFIFLDEADFFREEKGKINARKVTERYIGKSDPYIAIVSTPDMPDGFMWNILHEDESLCLYKRLRWHYTKGEHLIYDDKELAKAKASPTFRQEYCLEFLGLIGDLYHPASIQNAINLGNLLGPSDINTINIMTIKSMGIDPAHGGKARYGISALEWLPNEQLIRQYNLNLNAAGCLRLIYCKGFEAKDHALMFAEFKRLFYIIKPRRVYVDDTASQEIKKLKHSIGERVDYQDMVKNAKKVNIPLERYSKMIVTPLNFQQQGKEMNYNGRAWLNSGLIAIHEESNIKLIAQMNSARTKDNGMLDKDDDSMDELESFHAALKYFTFEQATGAAEHAIRQ